ncbi:DUF3800 domain-containing protein [Rhizobium leguminosarum bv. viciae]|nr:DUF3800 domain-containing protein [Rhizobium leguminosarum bv. viciae]
MVTRLRYVYIDESGTHADSPSLAMAAYVFEEAQAPRFSRDWQRDLKQFGLPYAHMTDCATGNGHYASLSMQQRIETEKALIAHIRHRSLVGIAVAVDYSRYRELFGKGRYDHDAYTFCTALCIRAVHEWGMRSGFSGQFVYVFEAGHAAQGEANLAMNNVRSSSYGESYNSHMFLDKQDAPPLQAADMLAWQWGHYLRRRAQGHDVRRKDFDALMRPKDELIEITPDLVDQWRVLMDGLDQEILETSRKTPGITDGDLAYAASQMKLRSE